MKIGVLDDNPAILSFVANTLRLDGHTVFSYTTGESLLNSLFPEAAHESTISCDLVILDLLLPGQKSGIDVFFTLRQAFHPWQLPIIIITAVGGPTLDQFRAILPDDVPLLRKPFSPRTLRQTINNLTS